MEIWINGSAKMGPRSRVLSSSLYLCFSLTPHTVSPHSLSTLFHLPRPPGRHSIQLFQLVFGSSRGFTNASPRWSFHHASFVALFDHLASPAIVILRSRMSANRWNQFATSFNKVCRDPVVNCDPNLVLETFDTLTMKRRFNYTRSIDISAIS